MADFSDGWFLRLWVSLLRTDPLLDYDPDILWEPEVAELITPVSGLPW